MARHFTLSEAERILPAVAEAVRQAMRAKVARDRTQRELASHLRTLSMLGGVLPDAGKIAQLRAASDFSVSELKLAILAIEEFGCLIKDLDIGLVDFLTLYQGREVCLCWRSGEDAIRFWHGTEEGFRGRKPIDADFIAGHSAA